MPNDQEYKMVEFDKWCKTCKFEKDSEDDENSPCWYCLEEPLNQFTDRPVNYKEKD